MATSTSAAQINGESRAKEGVKAHGNSSAPDRCCTAVKARPPSARKTLRPDREASLVVSVMFVDDMGEVVRLKVWLAVVKFISSGYR